MDVRVVMCAVAGLPNVYVNRHPSAKRLGVQRPKGAGLNMLLGRLGSLDSRSTGCAIRKAYQLRLPARRVRRFLRNCLTLLSCVWADRREFEVA